MTYWLLLGTELGPKVALVSKVECGGNTIVSLLESDDLESANVIHAVKFVRGTGSEGSTPNSNFAHLLDDMGEDVLNVTDDAISQPVWAAMFQVRLPQRHRGARQGTPMPT